MNDVYMNHLMYADDLVLIAPSVRAFQVLLRYCDSFAKDNDVKYNAKKTVCMFVRPKELKSDIFPCVKLSGFKLKCVPTHKYLGFHIATDRRDDRCIRQQCRNMYSRGNTIIKTLSIAVMQLNVSYLSHSALVFIVPHYGLHTPSQAFVN